MYVRIDPTHYIHALQYKTIEIQYIQTRLACMHVCSVCEDARPHKRFRPSRKTFDFGMFDLFFPIYEGRYFSEPLHLVGGLRPPTPLLNRHDLSSCRVFRKRGS